MISGDFTHEIMPKKAANKINGEIITFYSYKGGTGRTMALSNVACILARTHDKDRILMIDWDLEAPGLYKFFFQEKFLKPYGLNQYKLDKIPGIIDLFLEFRHVFENSSLGDEALADYALGKVKLDDFIAPTHISNLKLLKAGRLDDLEKYSGRVNTFNWEKLYNNCPSLFRIFAERLSERYRYVLIDSRTGYTDISGICTMLMPEKLVVVYTPNHQSFTGIKELIIRSTEYRRRSSDLRPLLVYPLPSRIEFSRDDLREYWRKGSAEQKIPGYQPMFEDILKKVYALNTCNLDKYFDEVQIQQSPNYAYGEEIAIMEEKSQDRFSLTGSYEIFTEWLGLRRTMAAKTRILPSSCNGIHLLSQVS
jgi:eukaryotic-like serine/threonine-protein kinase